MNACTRVHMASSGTERRTDRSCLSQLVEAATYDAIDVLLEVERQSSVKRYAEVSWRHIHGCPENFRQSLNTPTATFPEIFMGFCSNGY